MLKRRARMLLAVAMMVAPALAAQIAQHQAAGETEALNADQQAAFKPLQLMCDGLIKKDARLIREQLLPGGMATQIRNGVPAQMHFDFFMTRLEEAFASENRFEETLDHPVVHIDHDVAVVWSGYVFTVNGAMDHCGSNVFTLYRRQGRWLVSNVADTERRTDCPVR